MKHVITIIECALVITVIGALLPGCASVEQFNRAHPEVLNAADQLCHVVHAAHEAEADASVQALPPPEPGAQ